MSTSFETKGSKESVDRPEAPSRNRRVNRHYTVNKRLLLVTLAMLVVAVPICYLWYQYRLSQATVTLLERADQLAQDQDWEQATTYYQRYLQVVPEDTDALVNLVEAYSQGEQTPNRVYRLNTLLYQSLGRVPEQHDLRLKLAENLITLGSFEEAEAEAARLVDSSPEHAKAAQSVAALARISRARTDQTVPLTDAIQTLLEAVEQSPEDVRLVEVAASTLRDNPTSVEMEDTDPATFADKLIDRLVELNPENAEAYLARQRYRLRYRLEATGQDLEAALALEPENLETLLLAALSPNTTTSEEEQFAESEQLLRRAIEIAPDDQRAYLGLAMILERSGSRDEAIELLQQGRGAIENDFEVGLALANIQLNAAQVESASQTIRELESQSTGLFVRLDSSSRVPMENQLKLLNARLRILEGSPRLAIPILETVIVSMGTGSTGRRSNEWLQAHRLLAQVYSETRQWDKASEYWGILAQSNPGDLNVIVPSVDAYLRAGNFTGAIGMIEEYSRTATPTSDLKVKLVQAHLALQLSRAPESRNWIEFESALENAKSDGSDRLELLVAEASYLLATSSEGQSAAELVRSAEQEFKESHVYWQYASRLYHELDMTDDAKRALESHREVAPSLVDHLQLKSSLLARAGRFDEAEELLRAEVEQLNEAEKLQLGRIRLELLAAGNRVEEALELAKELIDTEIKETGLLTVGIDLAIGANDLELASNWEAILGELTDEGPDYRYLRARRLLLSYNALDASQKRELGTSINELRSERPRWYPGVALAGQYARLQGDTRRALSDFQQAVDLGDRRPFTIQQLAALLYDYGRFDEAQGYLNSLSNDDIRTPYLDAIAIDIAARQRQPQKAIELAAESVQRYPEDPLRRLQWANLLMRNSQQDEALQVLRIASQEFANDPRIWTALLTALSRQGQVEEARKIVSALAASSTLPEERRHFVAAQGYETLGDIENAKQQYELAVARQPSEAAIRVRYARLIANSDPQTARSQLEEVLRQDPKNLEATRELAVLLASTGHDADWQRVNELLEASADDPTASVATDDRLRAMLLSRKGRTRSERIANCQAARSIVQRLIEMDTGDTNEVNRLLLAQINEQEYSISGDVSLLIAARDELRNVVDHGAPNAQRLSRFIEFLLRHGRPVSEDSEMASPVEDAGDEIAALRDVFLTTAEARLEDLKRLQASSNEDLEHLTNAFAALLLKARGRDSEALEHINQIVAQQEQSNLEQVGDVQRYLDNGRLYSAIGAHAEAEQWYRRLAEVSPNAFVLVVQSLLEQQRREEAAKYCLEFADGPLTPEVASILANVMTVVDEPVEELPEVQSAIESATKEFSDNTALLQSKAVMLASQGDYGGAISIFRRIIEIEPNNALALNNLATLLAEMPNQRGEALKYIERAIEIAGRQASLLDTQGTIYLKIGDEQNAIACLEEATAGGASDARYYLHLAAAYQQAERFDEARRMLNESRALGLERFVLTDDDRKLLADLDDGLKSVSSGSNEP